VVDREFPSPPASRRFPGGHCYPLRSSPYGTPSSSPTGEAVIMMDALRVMTSSGEHFGVYPCDSCNSDERSVQRSARSGIVQPVMRSLRRNHGRPCLNSTGRKIRETVRAERTGGSGAEHGRLSPIPREPGTSEEPPVTEGISPKSRGDERTDSPEH